MYIFKYCKKYLKIEECVDIFIDHDFQIKYHKSCIEDKDNIFKYYICNYCGVSLRKKCENHFRRKSKGSWAR